MESAACETGPPLLDAGEAASWQPGAARIKGKGETMADDFKPVWIVLGDTRVKVWTWAQLLATCRLFNLTIADDDYSNPAEA